MYVHAPLRRAKPLAWAAGRLWICRRLLSRHFRLLPRHLSWCRRSPAKWPLLSESWGRRPLPRRSSSRTARQRERDTQSGLRIESWLTTQDEEIFVTYRLYLCMAILYLHLNFNSCPGCKECMYVDTAPGGRYEWFVRVKRKCVSADSFTPHSSYRLHSISKYPALSLSSDSDSDDLNNDSSVILVYGRTASLPSCSRSGASASKYPPTGRFNLMHLKLVV